MAILDVLGDADATDFPNGMTVSDVARGLNREKSAVSRQLRNLLESGLVAREESGRYELSWRLFTLASRAGDRRLTKLAPSIMSRLTELVRERTHLTVLSDGEVLTVRSESSRRVIEANGWVGRTIPVHRSSSGMALLMDHPDEEILELLRRSENPATTAEERIFLSQISEARTRHYSVANRLFDPDLLGIGAPIRNASGTIVAALNISGPAGRIDAHIPAFAAHLLGAVKAFGHPIPAHL